MGALIAVGAFVVVGLFWWLVERYGHTQDRPPHQPDPALHEAQHRVSDTGEREVGGCGCFTDPGDAA